MAFTVMASGKPLRDVPGDYGLPIIGPVRDRFDYLYTHGPVQFFRSKIARHNSTVLRLNMPPGPPIASDPRVVALLDSHSFPTLFDTSKVDKKDVFTGTYAPSSDLTGGFRTLSFLDPSEPNHGLLKRFVFHLLASRRHAIVPEFLSTFSAAYDEMEAKLESSGKADFGEFNDKACFKFLSKSLLDTDPDSTALASSEAPGLILKWVLFQLGPILSLGLPPLLDDLLLRGFRLPAFLIKSDYRRLYDFFYTAAAPALDEAEKLGLSRAEACHNLLYTICFNSFGGMKILFPAIVRLIGGGGAGLHRRLSDEIRSAVTSQDGVLTPKALEKMTLTKSVVYECLRLEPPVPMQYGRAKTDLVIESHDERFKVRKGEMLFGYQPMATRDGRVFDRPEEFVPERFVGEEGERLLKYVVWSNGMETENATVENKQCAGKDFVVIIARLLVATLFLRYDSFDVELGKSAIGTAVTITSLKRATG